MNKTCVIRLAAAEKRMREAEEMNGIFLSALPLIMNVWDEKLNMVSTSRQAVELFGLSSEEEYIEKFGLLSPEKQPCGTPSGEKAANFVKQAFVDGKVSFEWMHQTLDGEPLPTEIVLVRFKRTGKYFVAAYTFDLRRLNEAFSLTQTLLDSAPFAIKMWDEGHNITSSNKQSDKLYELFGVEQYGGEFYNLSPMYQPCGTLSREVALKYIQKAYADGWVQFEWLHQTIDGIPFPAEITLVRSKHKNKTVIIEYTVDLSPIKASMERERSLELKLKEQEMSEHIKIAEESSKAKSRFLARMSHEFRTPLTAILGISEINIKRQAHLPHTEEAFRKINDSATMLLGIANDILDLSKIEAEKMTLIGREYNIASLVNDSVEPHVAGLRKKNIEFRISVDETLPRVLIGDALRIKQIINNLLSNASKYTEEGFVDLRFIAEREDNSENKVNLTFTVQDTGLGMTQSQLSVLYNDYERFHESGANSVGGTGLGMPIVYNLVKLMDATINIDSEVGKGTIVKISIPQDVAGQECIGEEMARNLERFKAYDLPLDDGKTFELKPYPSARVLVVDDVEANLYVAKGLLGFFEVNVDTCNSGQEAIDKIKMGEEFDIVFMDQMMPGINGTDTMLAIKDMGYTKPIVALTASSLIGQAEEFIRNGFDDFVSKPLHSIRLSEVLEKYLHSEPVNNDRDGQKEEHGESRGDFFDDPEMMERLRSDFARDHKKSFREINDAISANDLTHAHFVSHGLKGFAALIKEASLAEAAAVVEQSLEKNKVPTSSELGTLEKRLSQVLKDIPAIEAVKPDSELSVDNDAALALFDKLIPLLKERKTDSLNYLAELKMIPDAKIPTRQMEMFDFGGAHKSITVLKTIMEGH